MADEYVVKLGQVESIKDEMDGGRIKVRLSEDKNRPLSEIPYAFPINPKMFHCTPKVGECVLVITSQLGNIDSQRYYLGPVISQMQDVDFAAYNYGSGSANSLLDSSIIDARKPISQWSITHGAFPDKEDVAIIGRESEDVILKEGEIDLRCGIRNFLYGDEDKDLIGSVGLNADNPTYIQMKYKNHLIPNGGGDGAINIVADKINLVSHKGEKDVKLVNPSQQSNPLLKDEDITKLMNGLHPLPFGDELIKVLRIMCNAIISHVHPIGPLPPCDDLTVLQVKEEMGKLSDILSKNIKIN